MPAEDGRRLDEEQHRPPRWRELGGNGHREPLPWRPSDAADDLPFGDDQLLSEHRVLRQEFCARSEEITDDTANESKEVKMGPS